MDTSVLESGKLNSDSVTYCFILIGNLMCRLFGRSIYRTLSGNEVSNLIHIVTRHHWNQSFQNLFCLLPHPFSVSRVWIRLGIFRSAVLVCREACAVGPLLSLENVLLAIASNQKWSTPSTVVSPELSRPKVLFLSSPRKPARPLRCRTCTCCTRRPECDSDNWLKI